MFCCFSLTNQVCFPIDLVCVWDYFVLVVKGVMGEDVFPRIYVTLVTWICLLQSTLHLESSHPNSFLLRQVCLLTDLACSQFCLPTDLVCVVFLRPKNLCPFYWRCHFLRCIGMTMKMARAARAGMMRPIHVHIGRDCDHVKPCQTMSGHVGETITETGRGEGRGEGRGQCEGQGHG